MSGETNWFYEDRGERVGPVTLAELQQKRREGVIGDATLVWHPEFGTQWRRMGSAPPQPPSITAGPVVAAAPAKPTDRFAWAMALWPLAAFVLDAWLSSFLRRFEYIGVFGILVEVGCMCFADFDRKKMSAAGVQRLPSALLGDVPPIYLEFRKKAVGKRWFIVEVSVLLWGLSMVICVGSLLGLADGPKAYHP